MHYILDCPSCSRKLRFPIDRGKIRVTCLCGYRFLADPDDPSLYGTGSFDPLNKIKEKKQSTKLSKLNFNEIRQRAISKFFNLKYSIQNFKLLPTAEKKRIIARLIILYIALMMIMFLVRFVCNSIVPEKIII